MAMRMTSFMIPPKKENPYVGLLRRSLASAGVDVRDMPEYELPPRWLRRNRGPNRILHFHWPSAYYASPRRAAMAKSLGAWRQTLDLARELGFGIVWTVHNLYPHDNVHPDLQRAARRALVEKCTGIIAHCGHAAREVDRLWGGGHKTELIPHGNYSGYYGPVMSRARARRLLDLPGDAFIFLNFGLLRPYKGIGHLIREFLGHAPRKAELIIAGRPFFDLKPGELERYYRQAMRRDKRIRLHPRFVEDEHIPALFGAADMVVLPYSRVLTSGTVVLAHSMRRPVIVPALGCLPEMVPAGTGILYDPSKEHGLGRAVARAAATAGTIDPDRIVRNVRGARWSKVALATRRVYEKAAASASE